MQDETLNSFFQIAFAKMLKTYHPGQGDKRALHLSVIDVLKQVVGLEYIMWLQSILLNGSYKIADIFQLQQKAQLYAYCDLSEIWEHAQSIPK